MPSLEQLQAFVLAADQGSFSAAARRLQKAQSAVSTAVINLEIDLNVALFDRSGRAPTLTAAGQALLKHARAVLQSNQDFLAQASTLNEAIESELCLAVEQGVFVRPLFALLEELADSFPFLEVELLEPGPNDVAGLLKEGRADIGVMIEREAYPQGFHFRGVGHARLLPVCGRNHPLAKAGRVSHADLRRHRQIITRSRAVGDESHMREQKSPNIWYSESPFVIAELLLAGLGWAQLPQGVVQAKLARGDLVGLQTDYQQSDILQGIDVVWTERRALGAAGQWLLKRLLDLDPTSWFGD